MANKTYDEQSRLYVRFGVAVRLTPDAELIGTMFSWRLLSVARMLACCRHVMAHCFLPPVEIPPVSGKIWSAGLLGDE